MMNLKPIYQNHFNNANRNAVGKSQFGKIHRTENQLSSSDNFQKKRVFGVQVEEIRERELNDWKRYQANAVVDLFASWFERINCNLIFFCNLILKHETKFNRQYIYIKELCTFKVW